MASKQELRGVPTLPVAEAVKKSPEWNQGRAAFEAGVGFEGNPYKWHGGPAGMFKRARWEAGWLAGQRMTGRKDGER